MNKKPIDLVQLRSEIKSGHFIVYIRRGKIYMRDWVNGETVIIGDVKEAEEWAKHNL